MSAFLVCLGRRKAKSVFAEMCSWYPPARYPDWPGSSAPDHDTAKREELIWEHVLGGSSFGIKAHMHAALVPAGLRGCDQTFWVEVVLGTPRKGEPLPIMGRWDFCPTVLPPGEVPEPPIALSHKVGPCVVDGAETTVTTIMVQGRIRLEWAWPDPRAVRVSSARPPLHHLQWLVRFHGVQPVVRGGIVFKACCRWAFFKAWVTTCLGMM